MKHKNKTEKVEETIGGKAVNLRHLQGLSQREGVNFIVPKWYVISHEKLANLLPQDFVNLETREDKLSIIEDLVIPSQLLDEIKTALGSMTSFYAVRSSAVDEDGTEHSFAGQFESFLFVRPEKFGHYIKEVWKSAFSERVSTYRQKHQLSNEGKIAVIIQEMIPSEVSGVGFGLNPSSGSRSEFVISSVFGLGEGLVSGALNADMFVWKEGKIEEKLAEKTHAFVHDLDKGGVKEISISPDKKNQASLSGSQVNEVVRVLQLLRESYGKAQDIEFAYVGSQLYLLQSRSITGLNQLLDKDGEKIVWDNSNIIESYPGVTTPLTFSFILKMYEAVYTQFTLLLGISEKELEPHRQTLANMLGLIQGRVYYNLKSWFKLLALLPAYSLNAGYMEKMMGVKERFELEEGEVSQLSKTQARLRMLSVGRKMLRSLRRLPAERKKFKAFLDKVIAEYEAIDFDQKRPDELMRLYLRFEKILVKEWKAPLVNDLFAMIYFGSLEKLISKWNVGTNPNLHNDLHCGSQDIISTEPITRLFDLTHSISSNPSAHQLFQNNSPEQIWQALSFRKAHEWKAIKAEIDVYIHRFGERCVGELKLETLSYKQKPEVLIGILQSYVQQGVTRRLTEENLEEKLRIEAEKEVEESLKGKWLKRRIFSYVLRMSRSLVSSRENLRYERTRGFGVVRTIFSAIGKQFYAEGIIAQARDIFYLSKEEIFSFIGGTAISTRLAEVIALRKEEYATYAKLDQPSDRISTHGMVYHANDFYPPYQQEELEGDLSGIGCCPGRVKAQVRVIRDPREIKTLEGDILVTSSTDPGWVTLFPTASAILVERGSLLSHSAIVSREMGIPCIVGINGLLKRLKTGDWVEMDGSTGKIKLLEDHG